MDQDKSSMIKDSDYKNIFKNNNQAMIIHNLKGSIVDVNDATIRILGYSRDDFKRIKMENLIKKEVGAKKFNLANLLKQTIHEGALKLRFEFIKKDKKSFLGEVFAKTVILSSGINVVMLINNITEKKILEEKLKQEKELADTIIESAPNIIVGMGANSKIMIFNKFAEKLTGYKAKEVIGKEWIKTFISKKERVKVETAWKGVLKSKKDYINFVNSIITKGGKKVLISWNNACINFGDKKLKMVLSIGQVINL